MQKDKPMKETTQSDDEIARSDPDPCEHGWSRLHPQPCPECEDESRPAETTIREVAYVICPYLIYGDDPGYDLARPQEYPLPTCKRCPSTERGMPGCLFYAEHAAKAVAAKLRELGVQQ